MPVQRLAAAAILLVSALLSLPTLATSSGDLSVDDRCYQITKTDGRPLWGFSVFEFRLIDEPIMLGAPDRKIIWEGEGTDLERWDHALLSWRTLSGPDSIQVIGYYSGVTLEIKIHDLDGALSGTARSIGFGQDVLTGISAVQARCRTRPGLLRSPTEVSQIQTTLGPQPMSLPVRMIRNDWRAEILELHQFFQDWFTGTLPNDDEAFARFADVLDSEFKMITPSGERTSRGPLVEGLRESHGSRPRMRIWIENPTLLHESDGIFVASYEEWQEEGDQRTTRLSTVVFRARPDAPNGLEWLHVHETWIDDGGL